MTSRTRAVAGAAVLSIFMQAVFAVSEAQTVSYTAEEATGVSFAAGGAFPVLASTGDFFGDGRQSIVFARSVGPPAWTPQTVEVIRNRGQSFTIETSNLFPTPLVSIAPAHFLVGDFNRDGRDDIFQAEVGPDQEPFDGGQNQYAVSQPNGKFANRTAIDIPALLSFTHSVAIGDVNNDGAPDIYVGNLGSRNIAPQDTSYFLINNGAGCSPNRRPILG